MAHPARQECVPHHPLCLEWQGPQMQMAQPACEERHAYAAAAVETVVVAAVETVVLECLAHMRILTLIPTPNQGM